MPKNKGDRKLKPSAQATSFLPSAKHQETEAGHDAQNRRKSKENVAALWH